MGQDRVTYDTVQNMKNVFWNWKVKVIINWILFVGGFFFIWISYCWSSSFKIQKGGNFKKIFPIPYLIMYILAEGWPSVNFCSRKIPGHLWTHRHKNPGHVWTHRHKIPGHVWTHRHKNPGHVWTHRHKNPGHFFGQIFRQIVIINRMVLQFILAEKSLYF